MKRTTYIFIGMFVANVILAVILMVYLKGILMNSDDLNYRFSFAQQQYNSLDLEDVHTLEFITKGVDADQFYFRNPGKIKIATSGAPGEKTISYPVSDYLKVNKEGGILKVVVDLTAEQLKEDNSGVGRGISLDSLIINVMTDKTLKNISGNKGFDVMLQRVELDSLCVTSISTEVESSEIRSLMLSGKMMFKSENSTFNDLYIDLDKIHWDMKVKGNKVNSLYLTGSGRHKNRLSEDQYNRLVWEPKDEDARLEVTLKGKTEIVTDN